MTVQEQLDELKAKIVGNPSRGDIYELLNIVSTLSQEEKDSAISTFLDNYPSKKQLILDDLLSYPNYVHE